MTAPRHLRPLDADALQRLALRYVERYATTRDKLRRYLQRKLAERGWVGEDAAQPGRLAERMAELGYVDDRGFAESRAAAMTRRGLGARRVAGALRQAGIAAEEAGAVTADIGTRARESALVFARRKRIGPFATTVPDRAARERMLAAMLRAGHPLDLARSIVRMDPGDPPPFDEGASRDD